MNGRIPGYLTFTTASGVPHRELEERLGRALAEARRAGAKEAAVNRPIDDKASK
jgi:hypothetical protein